MFRESFERVLKKYKNTRNENFTGHDIINILKSEVNGEFRRIKYTMDGWRFKLNYNIDEWKSKSTPKDSFSEKIECPNVVLTFDDNHVDVYNNAYPLMKEYGIPGTMYTVTNWINEQGRLSIEQMEEMHQNGWTMANHTDKHLKLEGKTINEQENMINNAKVWLEENGFSEGANHVAYPCDLRDNNTLIAMKNLNMKTGRSCLISPTRPNTDSYLLPVCYVYNYTPISYMLNFADYCRGKTAIYLFHNIVDDPVTIWDNSTAKLREFIQKMQSKNPKYYTIDEWHDLFMDNAL